MDKILRFQPLCSHFEFANFKTLLAKKKSLLFLSVHCQNCWTALHFLLSELLKSSGLIIKYNSAKVFLGWRQPIRFTDFLAETVFWEFPFFIRNYKKTGCFWKIFKPVSLLLSAACVVLQSKQSMFQRIILKKSQFIVISDEKRKFSKHHFSKKVCETDRSPSA